MDSSSIIAPAISDREALEEFSDSLIDRAPEVERDVARLKNSPEERSITAELFRAIHNIKGDAALCKFELGVAITHPIESLLSRFRDGEILFGDFLAETILLAIDRLELATESLLAGKPLDNLELPRLLEGLDKISRVPPSEIESCCAETIKAVTGFLPSTAEPKIGATRPSATQSTQHDASSDLLFFRSLALQLESRSPLFKGRTMRILRLALETNRIQNQKVDPVQLEAAVYLHDIGMMYLPESVWLKVGKMSSDDKLAMRNHPGFAAGLLQRMQGWTAAAEMVAQHHEMPDGQGYPKGLRDSDICPGAKILSIVDAFEAVMLKHIHRGKNRSVLRAIAEINACDNQFSTEWIGPFNTVIRKTIET